MPVIVRNFTHYASPCILYLYYTTYTIKANVYIAIPEFPTLLMLVDVYILFYDLTYTRNHWEVYPKRYC